MQKVFMNFFSPQTKHGSVAEERASVLPSRRMPWLNSADNQSSKRKDFKKEKQQNKKKN